MSDNLKFKFATVTSSDEVGGSSVQNYLVDAIGKHSPVTIEGTLEDSESKTTHDFFLGGIVEMVRTSSHKNARDSIVIVFTTGMTLTLTAGRDAIVVQTDGNVKGGAERIIVGHYVISV